MEASLSDNCSLALTFLSVLVLCSSFDVIGGGRFLSNSKQTITCPESDTVLPYPGDCTRFVTCRDFKAHIRGCPPGRKFDKDALRCRFAFQTTCDNSVEPEHVCGSNEVYSECGPSCEQTCDEYRNDYLDCPDDCVKGCFCKEGFVRGSLRNCIQPRKCGDKNMLEPWFLINSRVRTRTGPSSSAEEQ